MKLTRFVQFINTAYLQNFNTQLSGGFEEPLYLPETAGKAAQIQFTRDYYRSALHELAHWCVAGEARRRLQDYGYWYEPDGRTQAQQDKYYLCEVKPQAVEWAFCCLCGLKFDVSVDNVNNAVQGAEQFEIAVQQQCLRYIDCGFPGRAAQILTLLYAARHGSGDVYEYLTRQL